MNTYEIPNLNNCYTALQVSEILGLDKNTILSRCKRGYYLGAIKTEPQPGNPHGQWLIPKSEIDNPTTTKDVATLTRQITPAELQQAFGQAITEAISQTVEPLHKTIDAQSKTIQSLTEQVERLKNITETLAKETRAERKAREDHWWKFWG